MTDVVVLNVFLYEEIIGSLTLLPTEQTIFTFSPAYIENPNRSTLSLSFKDKLGGLITKIRPTRIQIHPFFSNLLPEGHMRNYLANLAGVSAKREFFLLWALGRDLPGAVTVESSEGNSWPPKKINNWEKLPKKDALRFSLAGIQLKFSAIMQRSGGLTIPAHGVGGSWIVKLPSPHFEAVPENEYSMMSLARSIGMDIPEIKLVATEKIADLPENVSNLKGPALAIQRFDRTKTGEQVHIEDFAQVFGLYPKDKYHHVNYKNISEVIWDQTGEVGITEFIRRLVFNTLIGNADMHLKNWSLLYPNRKNAVLAPGYDFVSTISYISDDSMALNYVKSKKMSSLSLEQLSYFAAKASLPEKLVLKTAKETVERFKEAWKSEQAHLPLEARVVNAINQHVKLIPLYSDIQK
jgi:serine/threonine-protein kinase HipA